MQPLIRVAPEEMDVALEGLRNYLRRRDRDMDRLLKFAEVCRVRRVMTPYLEALV